MNTFYFCNLCKFIFISNLFIWTSTVSGLVCFCDYHCPDDHVNFTCTTNYKCFKTKQFKLGTKELYETHGCMGNREGEGLFQCRSQKTPFETPMRLDCCDEGDFCNQDLKPSIPEKDITRYHTRLDQKNVSNDNGHAQGLALAISISVCAMILFIIIAYLGFRYVQIKAKHDHNKKKRRFVIPNGTAPVGSIHELLLGANSNQSSGTGSGVPKFVPLTIGQEIKILEEIGHGQFSTVYKAEWRNQIVAAKLVDCSDEISYRNEIEIYENCNMVHENILGYIGGDTIEPIPGAGMQQLMITNYHNFGPLHLFLQNHSYDGNVLFRLVYTALKGLLHIHTEIQGSHGKSSMAHRNLSNKNIYVTNHLQCCIGGFSHAVVMAPTNANTTNGFGDLDVKSNPKMPSFRYMAPDMLQDLSTFDCHDIDDYQKGDIYAFGLVLWELILRYEVKEKPEEYSPPYEEYLQQGNDTEPSYESMKRLVVEEKKRCQLPARYHDDQHSRFLMRLIDECWRDQPVSRLTALRMRKSLDKYLVEKSKSESSGESHTSADTGVSLGTASTGLS